MSFVWPFVSSCVHWSSEIVLYRCCLLTTARPLTLSPPSSWQSPTQQTTVGAHATSTSITHNAGAPQGCMLSSFLYSPFTQICKPTHDAILSDYVWRWRHRDRFDNEHNEWAYREEVNNLQSWSWDKETRTTIPSASVVRGWRWTAITVLKSLHSLPHQQSHRSPALTLITTLLFTLVFLINYSGQLYIFIFTFFSFTVFSAQRLYALYFIYTIKCKCIYYIYTYIYLIYII